MLLACVVAVVAVALGLALGLVPGGRARVAGPLRTFALSAALTVVVLHLLPEAFSELGPLALGLFAATSVVPAWLRLGRGLAGSRHDAGVHGGLVAGYLGLIAHHVGDGLGLGAYAALPGGAERHADVMIALAVHTVPLVAVVAFAFQHAGGQGAAFRAAAGLAAASVFGVVLSSVVPESLVERGTAWIAALVAGLLVHVVTHDLDRDLPTKTGERVVDGVAAVLGVAASLLGGEHDAGDRVGPFVAMAANILGTSSLPVVAGIVLAALAAHFELPLRKPFANAFGATLALDGLVVAVWLGGPAWGALYAVSAALVARAAVTVRESDSELERESKRPGFLDRLDETTTEALPWIGVAFVLWALLASSFPGGALMVLSPPVALGLAVLVALPVRVPPAAAVLIAVALERSGLRFEAALVFAVLAPAPGAAELLALAQRKDSAAAARVAASMVLPVLAVGIAAWLGEAIVFEFAAPLFPAFDTRVAFLVLAALGARAVFELGLRGFLLRVFPSHDTASHVHAHSVEPIPASVSGR